MHTLSPSDMAAWAADHNYWSAGHGTKHNFIIEGAAAFGLKAAPFQNFTEEGVLSELRNGHILIALMGSGHFTSNGHFIVIADDWLKVIKTKSQEIKSREIKEGA